MEQAKVRTIKQVQKRRICERCGELATHQLTFLLPNARVNPASSAYCHDDCSWCSDKKVFVCDIHEKDCYVIAKELGMEWCASFPYKNFKRIFEYWEEVKDE